MTTNLSEHPRLPLFGTSERERLSGDSSTTPDHRLRWWVEVLLLLGGYFIYVGTRTAAPNGSARENALAIWHAEQWFHLDIEPWLNRELTKITPLATVAGYYYLAFNLIIPAVLLLWLYHRRPAAYPRFRTLFGVTTLLSLVVFWLLPVAPPRFVVPGMHDTVVSSHLIGAAYQDGMEPFANVNAAMPSLHVAWALWCTLVIMYTCRRRWLIALASVYPIMTTMDILATSNHFFLDAVGGIAVLAAGGAIMLVVDRLRRQVASNQETAKPISE